MKKMTRSSREQIGKLIVIDGIDQSGKETQTGLLVKKVRKTGFKCVRWDFPVYQTALGMRLRAYLARRERPDIHVVHLLYAANRWEVARNIQKQIRGGHIVIANRYSPSNLAYGMAHGLSLDWLNTLEAGLPKPSRVIILNVPVATSFVRKRRHRDIHEENSKYLERVRRTYIQLSKRYHWEIVNGKAPPQEVHSDIWRSVVPLLGQPRRSIA
jgi:dTMP kinase